MDKIRDIFLYFVAAVSMLSILCAVYQAMNNQKASAVTLGTIFLVGALIVFIPNLEVLKVWGVEAKLTKTLDRAEEIIGRLRALSTISAKATYLQMAWGNRMGTPAAKDKQAVLNEIDDQLAELKVPSEQVADFQRPFVKMLRLDFFFLFQGVVMQYAGIINSELTNEVHKASDPSTAAGAVVRHSDLITAWSKRVQNDDPSADLEKQPLADLLNAYLPKSGEWLSEKDLLVIRKFKDEIVRLDAACEKRGGYTPEAATYYDRYSGDHNIDKAKQLRNEALQ